MQLTFISLSGFLILLSDIPKPVSRKPYQGVLCWCGCPEYPVQERCSQGFPFAHKKYHIPGRHEWQLRPGLYRICFYKFLPSCHEEEKLYDTPMQDKPPQSHIHLPEILSDIGFYGKEPLWQFLQSFGYWSVQTVHPHTASELQEVSTRFSMVPLIFLTPNGMFIR